MPIVSGDSQRGDFIVWTLKLLAGKHTNKHMACWAICQYLKETSIWPCRM